MNNNIKQIRKKAKLTQKEASKIVKIPLRTYINYENDQSKNDSIKYKYILDALNSYALIDESHGILEINDIKEICKNIFMNYNIEYCILFGSYAIGTADQTSDIDLIVSTKTTGLKYYGMVEELRESLHKKVDVLNVEQLYNNPELLSIVLKEGIKIYEKEQ